jgi:tetratricopeptide (TPR) repeat protein
VNTSAPLVTIDEMIAAFAADAARSGPLLPLAALIGRLREPLRDAAGWASAGEALIRAGFAEPAAALLAAGLQQHPGAVELRYLRGNALRVSQHQAEAEEEFRATLRAQPAHRRAALSFAFMLREQGRIGAAAAVLLALWEHDRDDLQQAMALIVFLRESGAPAAARRIAMAARERWPDHARLAAVAGELALAFGDFAQAHTSLRRALALDPAQTAAWLRLSYCQRYTADHADGELFRSAWSDRALARAARICAGFALGKFDDDTGAHAAAAAVWREANALARADSGWQSAKWQALVDAQLGAAALPALDADAGFVPVFIVGLPRTGTTLVATRLARHADVHDRGELNWIGAMYEHVAAQNALADRAALASVAQLIRTQMRRDDAPVRCYVDKNPLNFRYLNLIGALFPNARIVHCRRGARDTALSLWSQHFAHPDLGFSYDFEAIASVAASERRLMQHWRATLPLAVLEVEYEALVAAPDAQFARIEAFLELEPAPSMPRDDGVITTASVWQARQPVHAEAIARWRRYADLIPELTTLFAD